MKILQISINNLASLEGETTLDFTSEPLASAGIFAITGPTGAGKSTILDALCLALYARTPRYVQAKSKGIELQDISGETISQGDPRGILRDGTTAGSASVYFVGIDGDKYEATWAVKRARLKVTGRLMAYTHSLRNQSKQRDVPGNNTVIKEEIERLIGLNFEQFTRSVLLAQGDFTAFMKADKEEKSALLEKLTGSQIYSEISKVIYEHYKNEAEALNNLKAKAENIDLLNEEQINQIAAQITELQQQVAQQTKEKALIDQAINWHQVNADLENKRQQATNSLNQALSTQEGLAETKIQLALVQKLQPLKSIQENLVAEKDIFHQHTTALETLEQQLQSLTDKKQLSDHFYQEVFAKKGQQEKALKEARPLLAQASNLDTQIKIATDQLNQQNNDLTEIRQNKEQIEQEQKTVQEKLKANESTLSALKTWLNQRQDRIKIAESTEFISSRLQEASSLLLKSTNAKKAIKELNVELETLQNKLITIKDQTDQTSGNYLENVQSLQEVQQQLAQIDNNQLEENITILQNKQRDFEKTQVLFTDFEKASYELGQVSEQITENTEKIESLTAAAALLEPKIQTLETQIDTTRSLIEKATLRNTENIAKLRASLQDKAPCPVCGSTDHPYASNAHPDLADQLLSALQEELNTTEGAYKDAGRKHAALISEIELRQKQQQQLMTNHENKQSIYQTAKKLWEATPFWQTLNNKPADAILGWLEEQIAAAKETLTDFHQKKSHFQQLFQQRELLQTNTETQRERLQKLKDAQKDLDAALALKNQQLVVSQSNQLEADQILGQIQSDLNANFPTADWFSNWQAAPDKFTGAIQKFASDWKQKQKQSDNLDVQLEGLKIELEGLGRALQRATHQLTQQMATVNKQQVALDDLRKSRMNIFEGKSVSSIESDLEKALEDINQQVEIAQKQNEELQKDWTASKQQQAILENNLKQAKTRCAQLDQKIIDWIDSYNLQNNAADQIPLDRDQVDHLLSYTEQWMEDQLEKIKLADQQVITAKSKLEQRDRDIQKHRATTSDQRSLEDLLALQLSTGSQLEQHQMAVMERQLRIENNQKNLKKQGQVQKQIEQQLHKYEGWAALNGLIGSRDGRRFREIAQQYTLDLLLGYANKHLYVLSKRYVLSRIPDSLAIQVIDQDMADELRSVYSLSGGESFLVSLALALGLASLSSRRLKVESLFIDEGFGSLDPTTLSVAMDALERLKDQGRKVGVISHVQEMTERIAVQIQVHKKPSGKSNISVESLA